MTGEDYFAIQNLIHSCPLLLDRGDVEGVAQLMAHAVVRWGDTLIADCDAKRIATIYHQWVRTYEGVPRTRHIVSNLIITPDGTDQAVVLGYLMTFQQTEELPLQPIFGGDFRDVVRKVGGRWRYVEHYVGVDLVGNLTGHGRSVEQIRPSRVN